MIALAYYHSDLDFVYESHDYSVFDFVACSISIIHLTAFTLELLVCIYSLFKLFYCVC